MDQYKRDITKLFHKMNRQDQSNLHKMIMNGDRYARDIIIQNCLPLVVKIAEKYHTNNKHIDIEDLIQEGNIALIRAVDNWDIEKGNISTVATWYIRNALNDMIHDARYKVISPYTLSRKAAEDLRKVNKVQSNDINEISTLVHMKPKRVARLINSKANRVDIDYVKDLYEEDTHSYKKCIVDLYELSDIHLSGIDKKIFMLYIGSNGKRMKIRDICKSFNMIEQDVRSIINRCKTKLRKIVHA